MIVRNIKIIIEYDGTHFSGWQTQPHKRTVQGTIEKVLQKIIQQKITIIGASRTDAGVHALGQVAHFHTSHPVTCKRLFAALNGLLPPDISVKEVLEVSDFHAQKNAKRKTYTYLIWNSRLKPALMRDRVWHVWSPLNLPEMKKAAKYLVGRHDFSAFRGANSNTKTSVREIYAITVGRGAVLAPQGGRTPPLQIQMTGNGFLKYMVRNIVGTLIDVGKGRLTPEKFFEILKSRDRKKAGVAAPACGLYLERIDY